MSVNEWIGGPGKVMLIVGQIIVANEGWRWGCPFRPVLVYVLESLCPWKRRNSSINGKCPHMRSRYFICACASSGRVAASHKHTANFGLRGNDSVLSRVVWHCFKLLFFFFFSWTCYFSKMKRVSPESRQGGCTDEKGDVGERWQRVETDG